MSIIKSNNTPTNIIRWTCINCQRWSIHIDYTMFFMLVYVFFVFILFKQYLLMWITGTKFLSLFLSLSLFIVSWMFTWMMLMMTLEKKICQIFHHTLGVVHFILDEKKIDNNFLGGWWPLMTIQKFCQTNKF